MTQEKSYGLCWICFICGKYYNEEKDARECSSSHEEFLLEPKMVIGKDMPYRIKVTKIKANKVEKVMLYRPEKEENL